MKKLLLIFIVLFALTGLKGQSYFYAVYPGDTILLNVNNGSGNIQWQSTSDTNSVWMPITGANYNNYQYIIPPTIGKTYIRAEITDPSICNQPFYGSIIKVRVVNSHTNIEYGDFFAGGIVFYKNVNGDGIVVTPEDLTMSEWGCFGINVSALSPSFGMGQINTSIMVSNSCNGAAFVCDTLKYNGYTDWYLPSVDELDSIYVNLNHLGYCNFAQSADPYWASVEYSASDAKVQFFGTGFITERFKNVPAIVRAVRNFSSSIITVQQRLDSGETPYEIVNSGTVVDSLYGKSYQDGLIFHFNQSTGTGLIAAPNDQHMSMIWGCPSMQMNGTSQLEGTGSFNTQLIVSICTDPVFAAKICSDLITTNYSDWYLPSTGEFILMRNNLYVKGFGNFMGNNYWTSSENNISSAFQVVISNGTIAPYSKNSQNAVRAIRTFTTNAQVMLNAGLSPIQLYNNGVHIDSIYGKTYQDGLIFYLDTILGRGLVCTPTEVSTLANWGCQGTFLNAPYTLVGSGRFNTDTLIAKCYASSIAMHSCIEHTTGGYNWYLPSKDEWLKMYNNLHTKGLGNFAATNYWTSTELDATSAILMRVWNGDQISAIKDNTTYIRAVHAFGIPFTCPIIDIDGNEYPTIKIGTQTWMAENLETSKLNNGTDILKIIDTPTWTTTNSPGYCWYNNDSSLYANPYGKLYNWFTVETGMVCPIGWHIPSNSETDIMLSQFGGSSTAGGALKETGFSHWNAPNTGATNESGFNMLPTGFRSFSDGSFNQIGNYGYFHSSDVFDTNDSYFFFLTNTNTQINQMNHGKRSGNAIRCIKD